MSPTRQTARKTVQIALTTAGLALLNACATTDQRAELHPDAPTRVTVAAPTTQPVPRRQELSVRSNHPIMGQQLWTFEVPPRERPIRFHRWRQW